MIPLSPKIKTIVENLIQSNPKSVYIFPNASGGKYDAAHFRKYRYYPALKAMGLPLLTPHCCRHTFATLIKSVDAPATDKQRLMGHTSFEMTAHYTHANEDDLRAIIEKI